MGDVEDWLASVKHDLVKRILWPARDRRDLGGTPNPLELVARLHDEQGRPTTPDDLWNDLRASAPTGLSTNTFAAALASAVAAAETGDIEGVLALQTAFDQLARTVKG